MKNSIKTGAVQLALFSFANLHSNAQNRTKTESYGAGIRLSIGADAGIPLGKHQQFLSGMGGLCF